MLFESLARQIMRPMAQATEGFTSRQNVAVFSSVKVTRTPFAQDARVPDVADVHISSQGLVVMRCGGNVVVLSLSLRHIKRYVTTSVTVDT